ncbi:MAG: hypothetical protein M1472_05320 [Planctomycetes bacterium]|jgi:hypothetical protein|nr:hypothetical protein [Planctomycetota bacterium]MDA8378332.1 hypothetical protein [Planctomycetia bacterium]
MILPYNWKEKLKPANLRNTINENSAVVSIIAAVVAIVAIAFIVRNFIQTPNYGPTTAYYYDTSDGSVQVLPRSKYPPLIGKTGKPTLVWAEYYTCSSCSDKKLAYLEKYSPQAKKAMEQLQAEANNPKTKGMPPNFAMMQMAMAGGGMLVRSPQKGSQWYPLESPEGMRIATPPACASGQLKACNPE